jgi:hypothetical protein
MELNKDIIKQEVQSATNQETKISMPLWKWVIIGVGVLTIVSILAYCAIK